MTNGDMTTMWAEFDRTGAALREAIGEAPPELRAALRLVGDHCLDGADGLPAFVGMLGALSREMRGGSLRAYVQRLRATMLDHADSHAEADAAEAALSIA